jgi:hypothetical protein
MALVSGIIVLRRRLGRRLAERRGLAKELSEDADRQTVEPPTKGFKIRLNEGDGRYQVRR